MGCSSSLPVYTDLRDAPEQRTKSEQGVTVKDGDVEDILRGNLSIECPSTAKIVRIFTSSTFTDTLCERNSLIERVYPRLKEFCQARGYEFQVVDMRWGVREEATDDHMTSELCLREVDLCKKLSTGPCFVTFLSHKYGYRYFPRQIDADEFEKIKNNMVSEESKALLHRWFKKDENAVPPTYIIQPISSNIPTFLSKNDDEKKMARNQWYKESDTMQEAILDTAKICLEENNIDRYQMSVTEVEIRRGILNCQDGDRSFWFHRVIDDIDKQPSSYLLSRYKECTGSERHVVQAQEMLEKLREMKLKPALPDDHHKTYNILWTAKGVDPTNTNSHQQYINQLCVDFERDMKEMIIKAISAKDKSLINSDTYQEVVQHTTFCQEKCHAFYGRQDILSEIRSYLSSDSREPCIVYGTSGSGKTSVVARAASSCRVWFGMKHSTVLRFLGTTPESSGIGSLLLSLTKQINLIFSQNEFKHGTNLHEIIDGFQQALHLATKQNSLFIFLDSLDQLDPGGGARHMSWLPKTLPPNVKIILSTLPETQYEYFPKLQAMFPTKSKQQFLEVKNLPEKDARGILDKWLAMKKRKLQPRQLKVLLDAFNNCPLPLFLKLSFDETCLWKSYSAPEVTVLDTTVRGIVNHLFSRVEALHGNILVSRALGYLTLSKSGLTEAELEDILSCDDDVLNDVYLYWTPPIRRLPPLLLVRMRSELEQYFVSRGADGARVTYWYHRQFVEAARERYLSNSEQCQLMHGMLADFFSGVWANGKPKSFAGKGGNSSADRHVATQPLMFNDTFNYRKINNLPYHRQHADQLTLLKSDCLCSYQFILAKLKSQGLRKLLDDYSQARQQYQDDPGIKSVEEVIQLSQNALQYNPDELPSQLLGRIKPSKEMNELLEECKKSSTYYLEPNQRVLVQPGGILVHCLAQHSDKPTGVDISDDDQIAVTCSYDKTINVWDVKQGRLLKSFDEIADAMNCIKLCSEQLVVFKCSIGVMGYNITSGVERFRITSGFSFCLCGINNEFVCIAGNDSLILYKSDNGKLLRQTKCQLAEIDQHSLCTGCQLFVATTVNQKKDVVIFDLSTMTFLTLVEGYCEAFVFSPDSSKLYINHRFSPVLCVYNIKTEVRHSISGQELVFAQGELKITKDGRYVYFSCFSFVFMWDIEKSTQHMLIDHPTNVLDVVSIDSTITITTGEDRAVRIWDLSKRSNEQSKKFNNGNEGARIMSTVLLNNPRYAVFKIKYKGWSWSWQLYDLSKQLAVKKSTKFVPNYEIPIDDTHVLICGFKTVKLLDLTDMEFKVTYQGHIVISQEKDIVVINKGTEFLTWSPGQMSINVYDVKTGKCTQVLSAGQQHKLESFIVNKQETLLITQGKNDNDTVFYIFDLQSRTFTTPLTSDTLGINGQNIDASDFLVSPNGKYFVFRYQNSESENVFVCDSSSGYVVLRLPAGAIDSSKQGLCYLLLSTSRLMLYKEDCYMKLYHLTNGRLIGEERYCTKVSIPENGPFFLTYGKSKGDNAVRVWDRRSLTSLASFYMDSEIRTVRFTADGYHVMLTIHTSGDPIIFQLKGGPQIPKYFKYKQLADYQELFTKSDEDKDITVLEETE